jgi:hypothetical protein
LVIELITACECTQLDWSETSYKKDQRSRISIEYNSKGKNGPQIVDVDIIGKYGTHRNRDKVFLLM